MDSDGLPSRLVDWVRVARTTENSYSTLIETIPDGQLMERETTDVATDAAGA